jgi:hypothetical protein
MKENVSLFLDFEEYYLFLDESGTPEISDKTEELFILSCIKVEKHYYDKVFRKNVLKLKKKHKIPKTVLHSSDIRKQRKGFDFLKGSEKSKLREDFFKDISFLVKSLDFEIFYFSVNKLDIVDNTFDIYWHALREILLMIKNNLRTTNNIINIFCESRNTHQNKQLSNAYSSYFQEFHKEHKFKVCFPEKLDFRKKDSTLYEISGLEITDLTTFPILNLTRNKVNKTKINLNILENYKILASKIVKNYHLYLYRKKQKAPFGSR